MGAYLDALGPDVWNATKIGYIGALTPEQQKWNAKARNAIIEALVRMFLLGLITLILLKICGIN
jgi:hypothetical protein